MTEARRNFPQQFSQASTPSLFVLFFQKCATQPLSIVNVLHTRAVPLHEPVRGSRHSEVLIHCLSNPFPFECALHHFLRTSEDKSLFTKPILPMVWWCCGYSHSRLQTPSAPLLSGLFSLIFPFFFSSFGLAISPLLWDRGSCLQFSFSLLFFLFFFFFGKDRERKISFLSREVEANCWVNWEEWCFWCSHKVSNSLNIFLLPLPHST